MYEGNAWPLVAAACWMLRWEATPLPLPSSCREAGCTICHPHIIPIWHKVVIAFDLNPQTGHGLTTYSISSKTSSYQTKKITRPYRTKKLHNLTKNNYMHPPFFAPTIFCTRVAFSTEPLLCQNSLTPPLRSSPQRGTKGWPKGVAVSHCITWSQTQLLLAAYQIRFHTRLWDHRRTGQL